MYLEEIKKEKGEINVRQVVVLLLKESGHTRKGGDGEYHPRFITPFDHHHHHLDLT
jgi:hypothetical protein